MEVAGGRFECSGPLREPWPTATKGNCMTSRFLPMLALATGCITGGPRLTTTLPAVQVPGHAHVRVAADDGSVRVSTADIPQVEVQIESRGYEVPRDLE